LIGGRCPTGAALPSIPDSDFIYFKLTTVNDYAIKPSGNRGNTGNYKELRELYLKVRLGTKEVGTSNPLIEKKG